MSPSSLPAPIPGEGRPDDPLALARLVVQAAITLRRTVVPPVERECQLPQQSLDVLAVLSECDSGRLRMSDLAARAMLSPSGLTRAVDRLCAAGLVRRESCSGDRRGSFASLTDEGAVRAGSALRQHRRAVEELFGQILDARERQRLTVLLLRVVEGTCSTGGGLGGAAEGALR